MTTKEQILFMVKRVQKEPLDLRETPNKKKLGCSYFLHLAIQDAYVFSTYCVLLMNVEGQVRGVGCHINYQEFLKPALELHLHAYLKKWMGLKLELRINFQHCEIKYCGRY